MRITAYASQFLSDGSFKLPKGFKYVYSYGERIDSANYAIKDDVLTFRDGFLPKDSKNLKSYLDFCKMTFVLDLAATASGSSLEEPVG